MITDRMEDPRLRGKIVDAETAASCIVDGTTIGMSGVTACGYPKVVPLALKQRADRGDVTRLQLISSGNIGPEIEDSLADAGITKRRSPLQMSSRKCADKINRGDIEYVEIPLHKLSGFARGNIFGPINIAIIEALRVAKDGEVVLTTSVGVTPTLATLADEVIIEINTSQPELLAGLHDIYLPQDLFNRNPALLNSVSQRVGSDTFRIPPEKIKYIVFSDVKDNIPAFTEMDNTSTRITNHLLNFLELEMRRTGLRCLPPLQSGVGNMANQIVRSLGQSSFKDLMFYCGILQPANLELLISGKAVAASAIAVQVPPEMVSALTQIPDLRRALTIRSMEINSSPESVARMQLIAMNSAIEVDIYGNANLSHRMGSQVVNGIGGADVFAQNAFLSIMLLPSTSKKGLISSVVPKISYQDISSHHIDILITEEGIADLRGKTPVEKAKEIIKNCASPVYRDALQTYLRDSIGGAGGHVPITLSDCFSWHIRLHNTGSMMRSEENVERG